MIRRFASFAMLAVALSTAFVAGCDSSEDPTTGDEQDVTSTKAGTFETFKGLDGKWYFHLLSPNGEKVMQSQAYTSRANADKGIESVRKNAVDEANYDVLEAVNGEHYFNLVAANGEIIGTSELYASKSNASKGVKTATSLVAKAQRLRAAEDGGARFSTIKGADGKTYFNMRAANGEIVLQSQGYSSATKAKAGIKSVRDNGKTDDGYEIVDLEDGSAFFRVVAANGEIIARSEIYVSDANAERGYETVRDLLKSELVADPQ